MASISIQKDVSFFLLFSWSLKLSHQLKPHLYAFLSLDPYKQHPVMFEQFDHDPVLLFSTCFYLNPIRPDPTSSVSSPSLAPPVLLFFHDSACPYLNPLL